VLPGNPRQARTNYRCSDQGLAGFACRTSTAPGSPERQNQPADFRNAYFHRFFNCLQLPPFVSTTSQKTPTTEIRAGVE